MITPAPPTSTEPTGSPQATPYSPLPPDWAAQAETVGELIGTAIGAGSMCWENVGAAGVFDSTRAGQIVTAVLTQLGRMGLPEGTPLDAADRLGSPVVAP